MNRFGRLVLVLSSILLSASCCHQNYSKLMQKKVKATLGSDFRKYDYFSYPTNNYGLATSFVVEGDKVSDAQFLCDSAYCLNVKPADASAWLNLGGFAAVGGNGPTLTLSEKEESAVKTDFVLPDIYKALNLGASVDTKKGVTTKLKLGRAYPRKLRRQAFVEFIGGLDAQSSLLKKAFVNGSLAVVVGDVVIDTISVSICIDATTNAGLEAGLSSAVGRVVGGDASLKIKVERSSSGCYEMTAPEPVILARLVKRQPAAGVLAAAEGDEWTAWEDVSIPFKKP